MIARIAGIIVEREDKSLIIDVSGVGDRVVVGSVLLEQLKMGDEVALHTYHHITDGGQELYGFDTGEEQKYFELLLTVPSVGARTARSILDAAPPRVLAQAVFDEDIALLTKVSGVGKRTAERLLVELKEKVEMPSRMKRRASGTLQHEVVEALVSIGYTPSQARMCAADLPKDVKTVEEAVKIALKQKA
jgi:Holliday junction DNA helicase RuvA